MATSSEDVLLQMGEIRFKKGDGTLYVMNERLAWMAEHRDTVAVSHRYADIKMQKISPEGKPKVQLQVVLHDGNSSTFHFVNRNGLQAQLEDRDKVKELLQQLLPNFKRKVDKELEEKNRILAENPNLFQMYKDLVITQVITTDEFWDRHAKEHALKKVTQKQDIGVSGAFLADIKPQTDGCNGLKYNLTADTIHCIFKTYPAVKKKHLENVPSKMTEAEFWTKFFQSHYFHRDRITAGTKDIFTECGKIDDQALKTAVQLGPDNPLLDLKRFRDVTLEEGFGTADGALNENVNSGNIVHQNLIKRFNQHSIMVLNSSIGNLNSVSSAIGPLGSKDKVDKSSNGYAKHKEDEIQDNDEIDEGTEAKRKKLIEKIRYDDLGDLPVDDSNDRFKMENLNIQFDKVEPYFHGPTSGSGFEHQENLPSFDEVQQQMIKVTETWTQRINPKTLVSCTAAVNALGELSPGGALMRGFQEQSSGQLVPAEWEKEVRNLYIVLDELLKHFWKTFPLTTPEAEDKARQMHEAIQRFKMARLVPFENRAMRDLQPLGSSITQHLNMMIQAANNKYNSWQDHKKRF